MSEKQKRQALEAIKGPPLATCGKLVENAPARNLRGGLHDAPRGGQGTAPKRNIKEREMCS